MQFMVSKGTSNLVPCCSSTYKSDGVSVNPFADFGGAETPPGYPTAPNIGHLGAKITGVTPKKMDKSLITGPNDHLVNYKKR